MPRAIIKNHILETMLYHRRILAVTIIMVVLMLILGYRLYDLQIIGHRRYTTLSQQNQLELRPLAPKRGLIFDRHGILLAKNIPSFELDVIPDHVVDLPNTLKRLEKIISLSPNTLKQFEKSQKQHRPFEPIPLKLKLTEQEVARFYANQFLFPGFFVHAGLIRQYPLGATMAPVLGYVGRINVEELNHLDTTNYSGTNFIGKVGIEKYYEPQLHGIVGYQQVEVDAGGHVVRTLKRISPVPGANLYLTIDSKLQAVAEKALGDEHGAVVAIQPSTGEVLALVSHPSYDPNLFVQGIDTTSYANLQNSPDKPLYNRAIRGQFPIASTIKPFLTLEALEAGLITPDTVIEDHGWFKLPHSQHVWHDWNLKGHGLVNVTKALIVSCDDFFYTLAPQLGIARMDDILERFGFGRLTHIDLGEELPGVAASPAWKRGAIGERWYPGDSVNAVIGQGYMLTTPLQLANATATLANRGQRFRPHILMRSQTTDGAVVQIHPISEDPVMLRRKDAWDVVVHGMEGVVRSSDPWGTARIRFGTSPQYTVAAKTGTAQVFSNQNRNEDEQSEANLPKRLRTHSLFIAFAPVKHPKIAIAVIVEHSVIAGTVARKVLDYYLLPHTQKDAKHAA